ncbi:hypothetical protein BU17DRAFT_63122 [Hysterangium stoloniferum]|nr:hypothetical protein BU17DRAFT_63122 [Hysterangium stoloniferum]
MSRNCYFESEIHGLDSDDWEDISHDQEFTVAQLQGLKLSHEGGEFEHFFSNWKNVAKGHHCHKYTPSNTHLQIQASKHHQDWEIQLPLLFEAYMEFKYGGDRITTDISDASDTAGDIRMEQAQDEFTITVFGLEASPIVPSLAFSLKDLEIYHHCCLWCPQFSLQQWVKVMCDLSNINYKPIYHTQFSDGTPLMYGEIDE